jgi:hypothetical protein
MERACKGCTYHWIISRALGLGTLALGRIYSKLGGEFDSAQRGKIVRGEDNSAQQGKDMIQELHCEELRCWVRWYSIFTEYHSRWNSRRHDAKMLPAKQQAVMDNTNAAMYFFEVL